MSSALEKVQPQFWQQPAVPHNGIWDDGDLISYERVWALGDELVRSSDLEQRSLALLCVDNSAISIAAYLGFLRAGHAVFLADHRQRSENLSRWITRYRPEVVWGRELAPELDVGFERRAFEGTVLLLRRDNGAPALHPDLGLLLATSGSTGAPRVARLSYRALQSNAESIAKCLALGPGELPITSLHLSFAYGLSVINSHLACGASLACTNA
jgi:acyl-CoA synthetase (AMP-forming)/AMP-acid ligase II